MSDFSSFSSPQQLLEALKLHYQSSIDGNVDISTLKYVLYARKSTTSDERQERSIDDQIADCMETAKKYNLNVVKEIRESESAKEPGIRKEFIAMIEKLKSGVYTGLLTWHPDRLARNMKDAGEIIDLVDKKIIKDLRFATFSFESSPVGKMLLGISFVLSKQYSDHLSESVSRGIRRSIEEGQCIRKPKHGYYKDVNQYLRPDGENFILIKNAFRMRMDGKTQEEIAAYLNKHGYTMTPGLNGVRRAKYPMTVAKVSNMLRDPFHAGVLMHGDQFVDLTKAYDFVPMIEVEDFMSINEFADIGAAFKMGKSMRGKGKVKADFLRQMVRCGCCGKMMSSTITTKKKKDGTVKGRHFYYRCETETCTIETRSLRPKYLMDFIFSFLNSHRFTTATNYQKYLAAARTTAQESKAEYESSLRSYLRVKTQQEKAVARIKEVMLEGGAKGMEHFQSDLDKAITTLKSISEDVAKTQELIKRSGESVLTYEKYLELFGNLAELIAKNDDMTFRDQLIRTVFLNFTVTNKKVTDFSLKKPFSDFLVTGDFLNGRASGT